MKYKKIIISCLLLLTFLPSFVIAAGLIPCGNVTVEGGKVSNDQNTDAHMCTFADVMTFVNKTITWFIDASVFIAAITFTVAGVKILFNPSSPEKIKEGWSMFRKTVIGLLIVLGAWLVIHTLIITFVDQPENPGGALQFFTKTNQTTNTDSTQQ